MRLLKQFGFLCILLFGVQIARGQNQNVSVSFAPIFNGAALDFESDESADVKINVLRFYVSNVRLTANGTVIFSEENSFHYVDFSNAETAEFNLEIPEKTGFDQISFSLGIDSTTSVSGAMGGDLDPTKGMYWTWQSGYINFKLEGTADECPARKNKFQFHLGGYAHPYATIQEVMLSVIDQNEITIEIDLDKFLADINLAENYQVMQPNQMAVGLSEKLPALFSVSE